MTENNTMQAAHTFVKISQSSTGLVAARRLFLRNAMTCDGLPDAKKRVDLAYQKHAKQTQEYSK